MGFRFIDPGADPFPDRSEDPEEYQESLKPTPIAPTPTPKLGKKKKKKKKKKKVNSLAFIDPGADPFPDRSEDPEEYQESLEGKDIATVSPILLLGVLGLLLAASK